MIIYMLSKLQNFLCNKMFYWYLLFLFSFSFSFSLPLSILCYARTCSCTYIQVRDGYRLEKPEHCRRELYNIMYYCWSKESQDRPTFSELVKLLDKLLLTEMDYIQLEQFPSHNYYNMQSLSGEKL